jgi:hypothetical protein
MNTAPVMADAATPSPAPRLLGLRAMLIVVALLELADGLPNWISMFADTSKIPGPDVGSAIIGLIAFAIGVAIHGF